jgi:hypothetical protein
MADAGNICPSPLDTGSEPAHTVYMATTQDQLDEIATEIVAVVRQAQADYPDTAPALFLYGGHVSLTWGDLPPNHAHERQWNADEQLLGDTEWWDALRASGLGVHDAPEDESGNVHYWQVYA